MLISSLHNNCNNIKHDTQADFNFILVIINKLYSKTLLSHYRPNKYVTILDYLNDNLVNLKTVSCQNNIIIAI